MRSPKIPPMISLLVVEALTVLNGVVFDTRQNCPYCGGPVTGYDMRQRQFAHLSRESGMQTITVLVKRFRCRSCKKICNADEPFYPGTMIGSPVIDLCIAFSAAIGYGRAARNLTAIGVAVNRIQCRHFARTPVGPVSSLEMYGFPVQQSILSLSTLATGFPEGSRVKRAEALAACGFPSAYRAVLHPAFPGENGDERDEQERDEKGDAKIPENGTQHERSGKHGDGNYP